MSQLPLLLLSMYLLGCTVSMSYLIFLEALLRVDLSGTTHDLPDGLSEAVQQDYDALFTGTNILYTIGFYVGTSWYGAYALLPKESTYDAEG